MIRKYFKVMTGVEAFADHLQQEQVAEIVATLRKELRA